MCCGESEAESSWQLTLTYPLALPTERQVRGYVVVLRTDSGVEVLFPLVIRDRWELRQTHPGVLLWEQGQLNWLSSEGQRELLLPAEERSAGLQVRMNGELLLMERLTEPAPPLRGPKRELLGLAHPRWGQRYLAPADHVIADHQLTERGVQLLLRGPPGDQLLLLRVG